MIPTLPCRFSFALACASFVLAAPPASASVAPAGPSGDAPAPVEAEALVLEDFKSYLRDVEKVRGLAFTGTVAKGRQSLEDFRGFIRTELDRDLPPPRAECTSHALGRLGLLPEPLDLRKAYTDLLLGQVAAYYNPATKTFYLVRPDLPEGALRPTIVHELTHALQDQRFGLAARMDALRTSNNEDMENAFRFLAEGEATYVMTLATLRDMGIDTQTAESTVDQAVEMSAGLGRDAIAAQMKTVEQALGPEAAASVGTILSYPDYFFRLLLDPYYVGQQAIHRTKRQGGWSAVNDLWKNPPTSTEMFLHPEKLASGKRDEPVKVSVPDISAALGPGYAPACENTLGEMETEMLLEATLPDSAAAKPRVSPKAPETDVENARHDPEVPLDAAAPKTARPTRDEAAGDAQRGETSSADEEEGHPGASDPEQTRIERARRAAAGWGGDRYRAFEKDGGATVVVWKTAWDTDQDAAQFEDAMNAVCSARSPKGVPVLFSPPSAKALDDFGRPAPPPSTSSSSSLPPPLAGSAMLRETPGEPASPAFLLVRQGRDVTFVAGASAAQARAALASLHPSLVPASQPSSDPEVRK